MDIKKALDLWVEITGLNPGDTTIRLRDMDVHSANSVLEKSLVYDDSYITTAMLMGMYLEDFLRDRSVSLKNIIDDYEVFQGWLKKIESFKEILQSEDVLEIKNSFQSSLAQALEHHGIDEAVYDSMVSNENNLAELRYSAFNAINQLEVVQFSQGAASTKNPKWYKDVYSFRDINTLIKWMMSVESGVVVAMIENVEEPSSSYFVFAIRNGGTLSIVTDREKTAHPLESSLSRSRARGREFYNRITNYHFPYSILDVDVGDNHRAYITSTENQLMVKEDGIAIKPIKDLEPDEIVWLILMISLLEKKFFQEDFKTKELSYTARMMAESDFLLEEARKNEVAITSYPVLQVPTLTTESMKTENMNNMFSFNPTGQHDWMIERYSVPEEVFHVVSDKNPQLMLPDGETLNGEMIDISLKKMELSSFGNIERLEKDRIYLARYNQAKVINQKAKNEYEQRRHEVIEWFSKAIQENLPNLLESIARGELIASKDPEHARTRSGGWEKLKTGGNMLRVDLLKGEDYYGFTHCHIKGESSEMSKITCALNDTTASLVGHFYPRTANQLADLCGCETHELHELLQHWKMEEQTPGNYILDSVDPMDWAIQDPWEKLRMDVRIYLSKKAYNQLCKEHKTKNQSFWLNKTE